MRTTTKVSVTLLIGSLLIIGAINALHLTVPVVLGESRLGRLQRVLGILPKEFAYEHCVLAPSLKTYLESAQYSSDGVVWLYGFIPRRNSDDSSPSFVLLATEDGARVSLGKLEAAQRTDIAGGLKNCVRESTCEQVSNALGSGLPGLIVGQTNPQTILIPDLGLSATVYGHVPEWLRCTE